MTAQFDVHIKAALGKHPASLLVEIEGCNDAWAVTTKGFDGALGQIVPRKIEVAPGDGTDPAVITFESTYALMPSIAIRVPGFQEVHVSRGHHHTRRSIVLEGEDLSVSRDGDEEGCTLLRRGDPIARIREMKGDELGTTTLGIDANGEHALLATCVAAAGHFVG